jgi:hypothetical protein
MGWLAAALLAVLASFAKVYSFSMPANGDQSDRIHYSLDGWGRIRVFQTPDTGVDFGSYAAGPRYGVLLCLAAAAMLLGWLIQRRALGHPRLAPPGLPVSGLGSVFLCGVVACQFVDSWPATHGATGTIPFGPSLYLGGGSALLGVATWIVQQRSQRPAAPLPAPATEDPA